MTDTINVHTADLLAVLLPVAQIRPHLFDLARLDLPPGVRPDGRFAFDGINVIIGLEGEGVTPGLPSIAYRLSGTAVR